MSVAQPAPAKSRNSSRWLLLGSLALNLFFVGIAIAMAIRGPPPRSWDRDIFVRVERLAATLPPADAGLLRADINASRDAIDAAQVKYYASREAIRDTLQQDPFEPTALRAAMATTRATRQAYDLVVQDVFAGAATKMSPAGRKLLADWPPGRKPAGGKP